jgi:hypothetical protein
VGASVVVTAAAAAAAVIGITVSLAQEQAPVAVATQAAPQSGPVESDARPPRIPTPAPSAPPPPGPVAAAPQAPPPPAPPVAPAPPDPSVPQPSPPPAPPPAIPPPPPLDTSADAPLVLTIVGADDIVRPTLNGLAEPLATIVVTDESATVLATVTADASGLWTTGELASLSPAAISLSVVQTDQAGNVSPAAVIALPAFRPVIVSPAAATTIPVGGTSTIAIDGWAGEAFVLAFDGTAVLGGHQEFSDTIDASGHYSVTALFLAPGDVTMSVYYAASDPSSAASVSYQIVP